MQQIRLTKHAIKQAKDRGVSFEEIKEAVLNAKWKGAKYNRYYVKQVFDYNKPWEGTLYKQKEVKVIFAIESDNIVIITAIAKYYKG